MLIIIIWNVLKPTSPKHDKQHPNESINHKQHTLWTEVPSETSSHSRARTIDCLCTLVPSSGEGSYASQTHGTYRSTPIMLMEIMIQPQTHKQHPWLTHMPSSMMTETKTKTMQKYRSWSDISMGYYAGTNIMESHLASKSPSSDLCRLNFLNGRLIHWSTILLS